MRRAALAIAALVVVAAAVGCRRSNGAYCDDARPCPSGFACDLTARECNLATPPGSDLAGVSTDMAGCACSNPTPVCVAATCVSCLSTSDPEGACSAASPSTPHCLTSGSNAGSCAACRDANDCSGSTPFCDATTHVCRGCAEDAECPSLVCDLTPGSVARHTCIPMSQVEYADKSAAAGGNGLTPTTAKQKIGDGLTDAVNHGRPYLRIAAGTYNENVGVKSGSIYLVGADGTIIAPSNGDAIGASMNGVLTVRNIIATATNGNAANCSNMGTGLTAYRSQFINSSQYGVYTTTSCGNLILDGVWVHGNMQVGISVSSPFTIINSIITKNQGLGGVYQGGSATTQVFVNNTVADNTTNVSLAAGVYCISGSGFNVQNSILYNNKSSSTVNETSCMGSFNASDDPSAGPQSTVDLTAQSPGFKGTMPPSPDSYHIVSTSPCVNEASPTGAPDHDFDFLPRPDARTGKLDIGATEVQ